MENYTSSIACVIFISFKERFEKYKKVKYAKLVLQMALFIFLLFNLLHSVILIVRSQYFKQSDSINEVHAKSQLYTFNF